MLKKTLIATLVIAPLLASALLAVTIWYLYQRPYQGPEVVFMVKPGDTFGQVNARLSQQGLIENPRLFHWLARYQKVMGKLRAGSYLIPTGVKMEQVLNILINGQPLLNSVTIPEGRNIYQVAEILERAGFGNRADFLSWSKDSSLLKELDIPSHSLEGYLFPETYKFAPGTSVPEILSTMVKHFRTRVGKQTEGHPFLTPHEVVILASVVEKETGAKEERPQIASVFLNRLKKRMRLESDPTTIYGMWERYQGNIRRDDLQELTPYNTYKIPALPLGPIANPSLEAIQAVMAPTKTEFLFFVSKNDGRHIFTTNYADHLKAVDEWQRKKENRQGRSWRQLNQNDVKGTP